MRAGALLAMMTLLAMAHAPAAEWRAFNPIPDSEGFAGGFAGVSAGALLFAGGANIPGEKWGPQFVKAWYDNVWLLDDLDGTWRKVGRLPEARGYGVSISTPQGLVCVGGANADHHTAEVLLLEWTGQELRRSDLPALPRPCAMMAGALVGSTIYVLGGTERPDATQAMNTFWKLDLDQRESGWKELAPCPGGGRILPVAAGDSEAFYVFSGARLAAGADGKPVRTYLRDAWRYRAASGWQELAELPRAAVAAPSPAPMAVGVAYIFSGDDGLNVKFEPVKDHPGFPRDTLRYDAAADHWNVEPGLPFSRATAPVAHWRDHWVVPNGEVRPRVRTPEVWAATIPQP